MGPLVRQVYICSRRIGVCVQVLGGLYDPPTFFKVDEGYSEKDSRSIHPVPIAREGLSSRVASELLGGAVLLALEWSWQSLLCPFLRSGCLE